MFIYVISYHDLYLALPDIEEDDCPETSEVDDGSVCAIVTSAPVTVTTTVEIITSTPSESVISSRAFLQNVTNGFT